MMITMKKMICQKRKRANNEFDDYDDESYETKPLPQTKNKKSANKKSSKKKYDIEFIDL